MPGASLTAVVYHLENGERAEIGRVLLQDGKVVLSDDGHVMRSLVRDPITMPGRKIYAAREPEEFVRNLPNKYRSAYFWVELL